MSTTSNDTAPIALQPGQGEALPAPSAPPDMAAVSKLAAEHGIEILGPPGIPA
jgi:hypothetical protein